jgi:hypothetical protein
MPSRPSVRFLTVRACRPARDITVGHRACQLCAWPDPIVVTYSRRRAPDPTRCARRSPSGRADRPVGPPNHDNHAAWPAKATARDGGGGCGCGGAGRGRGVRGDQHSPPRHGSGPSTGAGAVIAADARLQPDSAPALPRRPHPNVPRPLIPSLPPNSAGPALPPPVESGPRRSSPPVVVRAVRSACSAHRYAPPPLVVVWAVGPARHLAGSARCPAAGLHGLPGALGVAGMGLGVRGCLVLPGRAYLVGVFL